MLQHLFVGKIGDASVDEDLKALNVASMNSANRCLNQTDHISKEHEEDHQLRMKTAVLINCRILAVGQIFLIECPVSWNLRPRVQKHNSVEAVKIMISS
jgi:hypothetical protein